MGHRLFGDVSKAGGRPRGEDLYPMDLPFIGTSTRPSTSGSAVGPRGRDVPVEGADHQPREAPVNDPLNEPVNDLVNDPVNDPSPGPGLEAREAVGRLLRPRAVALVGASNDLAKFSGQPLRNLLAAHYPGAVHPVNPRGGDIGGVPALSSVRGLPDGVDVAMVMVPAAGWPRPFVSSAPPECQWRSSR